MSSDRLTVGCRRDEISIDHASCDARGSVAIAHAGQHIASQISQIGISDDRIESFVGIGSARQAGSVPSTRFSTWSISAWTWTDRSIR